MPKTANTVDVFPGYVSDKVEVLGEYPKTFSPRLVIYAFVLFMSKSRKIIYYEQRAYRDRYVQHFQFVLTECSKMQDFLPDTINWDRIPNKLGKAANELKNVDQRTGFKIGNNYLVKAFFTFGLRTVPRDHAHIFQILRVPVLFYLLTESTKKAHPKLNLREKRFPYEDINKYERRILKPWEKFAVPAGTTYFIFTTQKCLFALDVVHVSQTLPFSCEDPVAVRTTRLEDFTDTTYENVRTPYIAEVDREDEQEHRRRRQQQTFQWVLDSEQQQQPQQIIIQVMPDQLLMPPPPVPEVPEPEVPEPEVNEPEVPESSEQPLLDPLVPESSAQQLLDPLVPESSAQPLLDPPVLESSEQPLLDPLVPESSAQPLLDPPVPESSAQPPVPEDFYSEPSTSYSLYSPEFSVLPVLQQEDLELINPLQKRTLPDVMRSLRFKPYEAPPKLEGLVETTEKPFDLRIEQKRATEVINSFLDEYMSQCRSVQPDPEIEELLLF